MDQLEIGQEKDATAWERPAAVHKCTAEGTPTLQFVPFTPKLPFCFP